jgi:hypothetical protein
VSDAILAAGSILLEKVCSNCRANIAGRKRITKPLELRRYRSINDEGSRQILPGAFRHRQLLPGTLCTPGAKEAPDGF